MKTVFEVGDTVLTIKNRDGMPAGQIGVVRQPLGNRDYHMFIQVKFDPSVEAIGHPRETWWFSKHELELVKLEPLLGDDDEDCV